MKSGGRPDLRARTPIQHAVIATLSVALFGVLFRFGYGALDPDGGSWAIVIVAPLIGLIQYVRATGRDPVPPELMIALGYGMILIYLRGLLRDGLPSSPVDKILWIIIFGLPVVLIVWGVVRVRRRETRRDPVGGSSSP